MMRYNFETISVLVIEDNVYFRLLLCRMLRGFGFKTIHQAADGDAGLRMLALHSVDIVLCDWEMAPMNGEAFVRQVRRSEGRPNPTVPIIMISSHTEQAQVLTARDFGITEFLAKPVSPATLYNRIVRVVEKPRMFVIAPNYVGPDRRRFVNDGYSGTERRTEQPPPSPPQAPAREIATS